MRDDCHEGGTLRLSARAGNRRSGASARRAAIALPLSMLVLALALPVAAAPCADCGKQKPGDTPLLLDAMKRGADSTRLRTCTDITVLRTGTAITLTRNGTASALFGTGTDRPLTQ